MRSTSVGTAAAALATALLAQPLWGGDVTRAAEPVGAAAGRPAAAFDFDGNGSPDLAIGVPEEAFGGLPDVGVVQVLYSDGQGVHATGDELWHQGSAGVPGTPEPGDHFGAAVASGDFDADGFADLVIGSGDEAVGATPRAGAVTVLRGSPSGLTTRGALLITQDTPGVPGTAERQDHFGQVLATGDLDADGHADLAVGVHGEGLGEASGAGAVHVLYGSPSGLRAAGSPLFTQDTPGVPGTVEIFDSLGGSLATGDVDADGDDDLAVGAPMEAVGDQFHAGAVVLLRGGPTGVTARGAQLWSQESPGVRGVAEHVVDPDDDGVYGDGFGAALALGDVDADGFADLAVGVPLEAVPGLDPGGEGVWYHGAAHLLYGSGAGLTAERDELLLAQDQPGGSALGSRFGVALAAGDVDGDGDADLAVGAPGQGSVWLAHGTREGLSGLVAEPLRSDGPGAFGTALTSRDLGGSAADELVIADPGRRAGDQRYAGGVAVAYGGPAGPGTRPLQWWQQDSPGVQGTSETGDDLGIVASDGCFVTYTYSCAHAPWSGHAAAPSR